MFKSIIASAMILAAYPTTGLSEVFEVKMLNGNATGGMAFEPDFVAIKPGDTVKFLATQRGHNAAIIDDFIPEGAATFKGKINQEIEVTFTEEGFYGVKCTPHYDMGMVMMIQVGEGSVSDAKVPETVPAGARKRFSEIIDRAK